MALTPHTLRLYLDTARHLRLSQMYWRARYRLARRLHARPTPPDFDSPPPFDTAALDRLRVWTDCLARHAPATPAHVAELRAGRFVFLNHAESAAPLPPWDCSDLPRLWRYHLHYFDYARTLAAAPDAGAKDSALLLRWIHDWIDKNPPGTDVAWDAFPTAQRIINWSAAESIARTNDPALRTSLAQQIEWLSRHLEYDVLANHLLKDAAALVVGAQLAGNRDLLAKGMALLEREAAGQVLPDGGHYERSPMYHMHVLLDLLWARAALPAPPAWIDAAIARMTVFLEGICHGDGDIPLFNDAARDPEMPARALIDAAREIVPRSVAHQVPRAFPDTGIYVLESPARCARMIVKAGPIGPDEQPGHAHADHLSFEFSVGDVRLLVDSGVHGYAGSRLRAYVRSTRAHNTLCVNGRDQIECWDIFRVARRVPACVDSWDGSALVAHHDGYSPWRHTRSIRLLAPATWCIDDVAEGPGACSVESFFHAHPSASFRPEGDAWALECEGVCLRILPAECGDAAVVQGVENPPQGWYCPQFGMALPAPVLIFKKRGRGRVAMSVALTLA